MTYRANAFVCDRCADEITTPTATIEFFTIDAAGALDLCHHCTTFCLDLIRNIPPAIDIDAVSDLFEHEPPDTYHELRIA